MRRVAVLALLFIACGPTPVSLEGLHRSCPLLGCAAGQSCVQAAGIGQGGGQVCEIHCNFDKDCPADFQCNNDGRAPNRPQETCVENDAVPTTEGLHSHCESDSDCHHGHLCFTGKCELPCQTDGDCLPGVPRCFTGTCEAACRTDADCAAPTRCTQNQVCR